MGDVPRSMLLLAGILLIEILFYGFGAAIQELGSSELSRRKEEGDRRAAGILKILEKPFSYAGVVQAVSGVGGLINGAVLLKTAERLLLHSFSNKQIPAGILTGITVVLAAVLLLTVFLSVGVALPKRLAAHAPEAWAYRLYPAIRVLSLLFYPLVCLVSGVSAILARLFGVRPGEDADSVTEEDIMSMVNEGHEQGVIKADEAEMITNIFEFDDKEAGDIMTHRTSIQALSADLTLDEAVTEMLSGKNSRYPVYRETLDDVIGILHLKDAVLWQKQRQAGEKTLSELSGLLRTARFIPETRNVRKLFQVMQASKLQMVLVVDEYGQVAGLITMEDILEEIVGDILDEYDVEERMVQPLKNGYLMRGMTPLEDAEEILGISFGDEEYDTVNGFLISRLDRIPSDGERPVIRYDGWRFSVLRVKHKIIDLVRVERTGEQETGAEAGEEQKTDRISDGK